jgi:hypothetical protein
VIDQDRPGHARNGGIADADDHSPGATLRLGETAKDTDRQEAADQGRTPRKRRAWSCGSRAFEIRHKEE